MGDDNVGGALNSDATTRPASPSPSTIRRSVTFSTLGILKKLSFGSSPRGPTPVPPATTAAARESQVQVSLRISEASAAEGGSGVPRRTSFDMFKDEVQARDTSVEEHLKESRSTAESLGEKLDRAMATTQSMQYATTRWRAATLALISSIVVLTSFEAWESSLSSRLTSLQWASACAVTVAVLLLVQGPGHSDPSLREAVLSLQHLRTELELSAAHFAKRRASIVAASLLPGNVSADELASSAAAAAAAPIKPEGMRLNCFAGVANLDFERDVLAKIESEEHKAAYAVFHERFEKAWLSELTEAERSPPAEHPDAFTQLRFLQADQYRVPEAVERLIQTCRWRHATGLDAFMERPNVELLSRSRALRPRIIVGLDKHARPLMVERLGEFFGNDQAWRGMAIEDWIVSYAYEIGEVTAWLRHAIEIEGKPYHTRMAYVGDLAGIRVMSAARMIPFLKILVHEVERHYPELAGNIVLCNAPTVITRLYNVVKRVLDPIVASKIQITSTPGHELIQSLFGEDVVPMYYGGKNPVFIPACPKKVDAEFDARYPMTTTFAGKFGHNNKR